MEKFVSLLESCYLRYEMEFELWSRVRFRFFRVLGGGFQVWGPLLSDNYKTIFRKFGVKRGGCVKGSCSCVPRYRADGTCLQQKGPCIKVADPRHVECSL